MKKTKTKLELMYELKVWIHTLDGQMVFNLVPSAFTRTSQIVARSLVEFRKKDIASLGFDMKKGYSIFRLNCKLCGIFGIHYP